MIVKTKKVDLKRKRVTNMYLKKIFDVAEKNGVSRGAIGAKVFGKACYSKIYVLNNPTVLTLERIECAAKELIEESKCK